MRRARSLAILGSILLALGTAGCLPDLADYQVIGPDGGTGDSSFRDTSQSDGGPDSDGGGRTGGPCALPYLLVTVEDIGTSDRRGRILRLPIGGDDPGRPCGELTALGDTWPQPFAATAVGADMVVVASRDAVVAIEPETDRMLWRLGASGHPVDAFPILSPSHDELLPAIAWSNASTPDIRTVSVYRGGSVHQEWPLNTGGVPLGLSVVSMTQSHLHPERLLALKPGHYGALEVDPWEGRRYGDPPYVETREGANLRTLATADRDGYHRLVWTGALDGQEGVLYLNEDTGNSGQRILGLRRCRNPEPRDCRFEHALPDPTSTHSFFALCGEDGIAMRDLVRFDSISESCELVVSGPSLGTRFRMSYLSLAKETPDP